MDGEGQTAVGDPGVKNAQYAGVQVWIQRNKKLHLEADRLYCHYAILS